MKEIAPEDVGGNTKAFAKGSKIRPKGELHKKISV
jgi:hypothetical protein